MMQFGMRGRSKARRDAISNALGDQRGDGPAIYDSYTQRLMRFSTPASASSYPMESMGRWCG